MVAGPAAALYSATAVNCLNTNLLSLSDNVAVQLLLANIPFFAVGVLGFAVATIMFVCRGMVRPGIFILISIVLAFVAVTIDLFRILYEVNSTQMNMVSGLFIAREVCVAFSHGARFLYFWDYASRPPIPPPVPARWNATRMLLEGVLIAGAIAVTVLQVVWRIAPSGVKQRPIYTADSIIQLVLGAAFLLMIARHWFSSPPVWYIRRSVPIMFAIVMGLGVVITDFFIWDFSDSVLGRFLIAIQMYIIALVVLVQCVDAAATHALVDAEEPIRPSLSDRRNSSFMAIAVRNSMSVFRSESDRPVLPRLPTVERMSQWFNNRMSTNPGPSRSEQEADARRLWKPETRDLESQVVTVDEKNFLVPGTAGMDPSSSPGYPGPTVTAGWRDPVYTSVTNAVTTPTATEEAANFAKPARPESSTVPASPMSLPVWTDPKRGSRRSSMGASIFVTRPSVVATRQSSSEESLLAPYRRRSMTDSPVYGLEGIIRGLGLPSPAPGSVGAAVSHESGGGSVEATPSSSAEALRVRQTELANSLARLDSFYSADMRKSLLQDRLPIEQVVPSSSYTSEFSLSTFPAPPSAGYGFGNTAELDAQFDLVPPPRVYSGYPETTASEESLVAEYYATGGGRPSVDAFATGRATQLDVTSFIGDLTTPRPIGVDSEPGTPNSAIIVDMSAIQNRATLASPKFLVAPTQDKAALPPSPLGRGSPTRVANPPAAMLRGPAPLRDDSSSVISATSPIQVPPPAAVARTPALAPAPVLHTRKISQEERDRARLVPIDELRALGANSPTMTRLASREDMRSGSPSSRRPQLRALTIGRPQPAQQQRADAFERPRAAPEPSGGV